MFGGAKGLERLKLEYNEITQGECLKQVEGFVEILNSNYFDWKVSFTSTSLNAKIQFHQKRCAKTLPYWKMP